MKRIQTLDAVRGLTILWIMALHFMHDLKYPSQISRFIQHGYYGVYIFLIISGFGISASIFEGKKKDPTSFLKSRAIRILTPFWISLIFAALLIPSAQTLLSKLKGTSEDYFFHLRFFDWIQYVTLTRIFTAPDWDNVYRSFLPVNSPLWYIGVAFQIYLIAAVCLLFQNTKKLFWIISAASWLTFYPPIRELLKPGFFLPYWGFFSFGFILHEIVKKNTNLVYAWDERISRNFIMKSFSFLGVISYSVYLMHVPLKDIIKMIVRNLVKIPEAVSVPVIQIPIVIGICFIWYLIFEKGLTEKIIKRS